MDGARGECERVAARGWDERHADRFVVRFGDAISDDGGSCHARPVESGLDVGTTLIVTGVYNLVTAICFDVPMPVQPMKTIAAVAPSDDAVTVSHTPWGPRSSPDAVFFLGATGLIDTFNRVPAAVVHGPCTSA